MEQITRSRSARFSGGTAQFVRAPAFGLHNPPMLFNRHMRKLYQSRGGVMSEGTVLLNKWQGQVLKVGENSFWAELNDLNRNSIRERAEFSSSDLTPADVPLVREGALFYWYIFYHDTPSEGRKRVSKLWFRRTGRMSKEQYDTALQRADEVWRTFGWPTGPAPDTAKSA
jgi:hypothetical protein